jgi:tetratricopeptide (TPR) repeat protein
MRPRRRSSPRHLRVWLGSLVSALIMSTLPVIGSLAALAQSDAGWEFLFDNRLLRAEEAFRQALANDRADAAAHRGLIVTLTCLCRDTVLDEALRDYARHAPGDPADFYLLEFLAQNLDPGTLPGLQALAQLSERLCRRPGLDLLDRRLFEDQALAYELAAGAVERAAELRDTLGRIGEWALLGPFDNTSGSGLRRSHIQSTNPDDTARVGKQGLMISWMYPHSVGLGGAIAPVHHFHLKDYTTAYMRTVVVIPTDGEYLVSLGFGGDIEFSIDRSLVSRDRRAAWTGEAAHWRVSLTAGPHELALKTSNRDQTNWVACTLTMPDGSPIPGLTTSPRRNFLPATGAPALRFEPIEAPIAAAFRGTPATDVIGETVLWRLQSALRAPDTEALAAAKAALAQDGDSGLLLYLAGRLAASVDARDQARQWTGRAAQLAPELAMAVLAVAEEQAAKLRHAEAAAGADRVLALVPDCRRALELKLECLGGEGRAGAQAELAASVAARLPGDPLGYHFQAVAAAAVGEAQRAAKWRLKAMKLLPPGSRQLAELAGNLENADYAEATDRLRELTTLMPDNESFWVAYVQSLIALTHTQEAYLVLHRIADSFPQCIAMMTMKAQLAEAGYGLAGGDYNTVFPSDGVALTEPEFKRLFPSAHYQPGKRIIFQDDDMRQQYLRFLAEREAALYLEQALSISPGNFTVRNQVRQLRGQADLHTYLPEVRLDECLARRIDPATLPAVPALILADWRRRFVYDTQASLLDRVLVVEVLNQAGIAAWENQTVPYSPYLNEMTLMSSVTVKPDGSRVDADVTGPQVVFRQLEPGDVIVLHYQLAYRHLGLLAGQYWDHHVFGYDDPCLDSRFTLILPAESRPVIRVLNDNATLPLVSVERVIDADYRLLEWWRADIPANSREPLAPGPRQYAPWVDISSIGSWDQVAAWYAELADGQAEPTAAIREQSQRLTAGCEDDDARYAAILRFVGDQVTYESVPLLQSALIPRPAEEVLLSRFGDCKDKSTLMVALLRAAGVSSACLALTTPWTDGGEPYLPSPRFNHAIVGRRLPNGEIAWYDPTVPGAPAGRIPSAIAGSPALLALREGSELRTVADPWPIDTASVSTQVLHVLADGSARLERRTKYVAADDVSKLRTLVAGRPRVEVEQQFLLGVAAQYVGATLDSLVINDRTQEPPELTVTEIYSLPSCFPGGDLLIGVIPAEVDLLSLLARLVAMPQRVSALDLRQVATRREMRITLQFPAGYRLLSVPGDVIFTDTGFAFSLRWRSEASGLVATTRLDIDDVVVGAASYASLKSDVEAALRALRTPLVLQKPG